MEKTSEDSSAQLSSEGIDVKGVASSSPALTASLPKNESESSTIASPKNKIQVNEPKVSQTRRISSKEAENAQADGINFKKLMNKNYISQWKQFAKDNIKKSNLYNSAIAARAGITGKFKKTKVGALMSKGFAKIKNIASNLIGGAKEGVRNVASKVGSALFKVIKSPADAIASFVSNRKETEAEVSSMLNNKDSESSVLNLADKMKDSRAIGQQRSAANLSPEFAQRVEAFLKDPRFVKDIDLL